MLYKPHARAFNAKPMRLWSLHPRYLDAKGLVALNQKLGGKVPGMIQAALPAEAAQKLQQYFQASNVRL